MTDILTFSKTDTVARVKGIVVDGDVWFKGKEVATLLRYANTTNAIINNVHEADKKTFGELDVPRHGNLTYNARNLIYINNRGLKSLLLKSEKPIAAELAKQMGIAIETKYLRKELEIVSFIEEFLTRLMIPFEFQKTVGGYRIDLYLPNHKLAIEIDEFGHKQRDPDLERQREQYIKRALRCRFLRINPDEENFKMACCLAELTRCIFMTSG